MDPSRKTILLFWRANMRYPLLFFSTGLSWLAGMTLQRLILALIASRALNRLVAAYQSNTTDYWHIFTPYIVAFAITAIVAQMLIDGGLYLLSKLETKVRPELQMRAFTWLGSPVKAWAFMPTPLAVPL
jgi:hypothetical protein